MASSISGAMKQIGQALPSEISVVIAKVVELSPLRLSVVGDEKRRPSGDVIVVAQHLTDYEVTCDISLGSGGQAEMRSTGDYENYDIQGMSLPGTKVLLKNALKVGDSVICLVSDYGQRYYVIDRVS